MKHIVADEGWYSLYNFVQRFEMSAHIDETNDGGSGLVFNIELSVNLRFWIFQDAANGRNFESLTYNAA